MIRKYHMIQIHLVFFFKCLDSSIILNYNIYLQTYHKISHLIYFFLENLNVTLRQFLQFVKKLKQS